MFLEAAGLVHSDEQVDRDVNDREEAAERAGHAFHLLNSSLVIVHASLQLRKPARLSDAKNLFHLALQYAQVCEDLGFEVCHALLLRFFFPRVSNRREGL
jgi:hypothetical protein